MLREIRILLSGLLLGCLFMPALLWFLNFKYGIHLAVFTSPSIDSFYRDFYTGLDNPLVWPLLLLPYLLYCLLRLLFRPSAPLDPATTPLEQAAVKGHTDTIKSLIAQGKDINARNTRGQTPLHLATAKGNSDEEIFRAITENVDDLIAVLDTDGRRIYNSPSYRKIFNKDELGVGTSFNEIHPEDRERIKAVFRRTVETGIGERAEFRFLLKDGSIRHIESQGNVVHDASGKVSKVVVVSRDVTERKKIEENLRHLTYHDMLTGLPNRILFSDRVKQAIATAKREKIHILSLMFMDLDNFKEINDNFGHAAGDLVLREVASRIQDCLRESDTAARMGGDEFVVLLPGIEAPDDAMIVAKKIRHALCQPIDLGKHDLTVTTSIGIAVYPEHGCEEETLLKHADAAMYHAKESGRDTVCIFSPVQQKKDE